MTDKPLKDLASEIETSLKNADVSAGDRSVLEQVHSELLAVLTAPAPLSTPPVGLLDRLTQAIERLEGDHPRLTSLLSDSLDALSDVGI
jgi:hypothetical protein